MASVEIGLSRNWPKQTGVVSQAKWRPSGVCEYASLQMRRMEGSHWVPMEVTANRRASLGHSTIQRRLDGVEACWGQKGAAAKVEDRRGVAHEASFSENTEDTVLWLLLSASSSHVTGQR